MNRLNYAINQDNRIIALDFLRSMAVVFVLLTHFEILDFYGIGVDLFFVLSGYLIIGSVSKPYKKYLSKEFLIKRFLRIVPTYYFFLIIGYLICHLIFPDNLKFNIPALSEWKQYFFFYRNYGGPPNRWAFEHLWSLCIEEHFYISILLLLVFLKEDFITRIRSICVMVAVLGIAFKAQAIFTLIAEYPTYSHNRVDAFAYGGLVYFIIKDNRGYVLNRFWSYLIFTLSVVVLILVIQFDKSAFQLLLRIVSPILCAIILICLKPVKFPFRKVLIFISYLSYNIYLWHYIFVIPIFYYFGKGIYAFLLFLFATMAMAILSTFLIDEQSYAIRLRFLKKNVSSLNASNTNR